jgi:hypothetical protein
MHGEVEKVEDLKAEAELQTMKEMNNGLDPQELAKKLKD